MQTLVLADILDSNMELDTLQNETFLVAEVSTFLDDLTCFLCYLLNLLCDHHYSMGLSSMEE